MKNRHYPLCLVFFILSFTQGFSQIKINEFLASNTTIPDEFGEFDDWVELKNTGSAAIDIGGYYFSDVPASPLGYQVPTTNPSLTTIPAGGYLVVWFDGQPTQGPLHALPKLSAGGESIVITAPDGVTLVDSYTFPAQTANISMGRIPDGTGSFVFMQPPSPNAVNVSTPPSTTAAMPTASLAAGFYTSTQYVSLTTATPNATIYYTLDGGVPTTSSTLYTGPIPISSTKVLRAIATAAGSNDSPVMCNTYFLNVSHTFPIVSLSMTPADIFGPNGIYPNYTLEIEKPMHFELFNNNAQLLESDGNAKIQGTASAVYPQKSLSLKAPSGTNYNYPLFPNLPDTDYETFVIRNSGQDWNITMFRDAMVSGLMREFDDIAPLMKRPNLNLQAYRPSVVYINGAYWGIHNMRERMNEDWVKTHEGWSANEIDLIETNDLVNEGDLVEWTAFKNYYTNTDFSNPANFAVLKTKMDVDGYMDYFAFNIIADNEDWPGNNFRTYRHRSPDGIWKWLVYDLDFSFGLFQQGGGWNTGDASPNALARALEPNSYLWPNPSWSTMLFRKLMANPSFKADFINRVADMLNLAFTPARVNARLNEYQAIYQPEIQKHFNKWGGGWAGNWIPNIDKMRSFGNNRPAYMRQHIVDQFPEVTGTANVTLQASPANGGTIHFCSLTPASTNLPWTGVYFRGNPMYMQAKPNRGFVFTAWSDPSFGASQNAVIVLSGDKTITANFALGSTSTAGIVINEINYNSPTAQNSGDWVELHNPTPAAVNIDGWYLEDESGQYFSIPKNTVIPANGFVVIVEDSMSFKSLYPATYIVKIGNFGDGAYGLKFGNGGEMLTLKNANGITIDAVDYDDAAPWPTSPDGNGPTLQLIAPNLDNSVATNWIGQTATPGLSNVLVPLQNQTITFPTIANHLTTDAPFSITATASSGLPVSFAILSGPASISGNTITLTGTPGTVTVRASQAGNAQYYPAPNLDQSFSVTSPTLLSQTITFPTIGNHLTSDAQFSITATASSGLPVSFAILSGPASISGNTITLTGTPGTVTVRASQPGNAQYYPAPSLDQSFAVTSPTLLSQTITFPTIGDHLASDAPFSITATASSGLPVSFAILSGPASISGNTITLTGTPGTVTVRASQAGNAQYYPAPSLDQSFAVTSPSVAYCDSRSLAPWHEWISKVQLNTINNTSFKTTYGNYTGISTSLTKGANYPISLTVTYSYTTYNEYWRVWIDYNRNSVFEDTEIAYQAITTAPPNGLNTTKATTGNIAVPTSAIPGSTRMRVSMKRGAYPTACETIPQGEVEDYTISIADSFNGGVTNAIILDAQPTGELVSLTWVQLPEDCTNGAVVERSTDGLQFEDIMFVEDNGLGFYREFDPSPMDGVNQYRLRYIAADNTVNYSNIDVVEVSLGAVSVFPNPAQGSTNIYVKDFLGKPATITVNDAFGRTIQTTEMDIIDQAVIKLDISGWQAGTYTLFFETPGKRAIAKRIIVLR